MEEDDLVHLLPLLSAIIPLALIPSWCGLRVLTGGHLSRWECRWGAAGAIVVNWGWGLVGPAEVAALTDKQAADVYTVSFLMRTVLAVPVCAATFFISQLLDATSSNLSAGIMAVAASMAGLSPAWFFVGRAKAAGIVLWDTGPRFIAAFVSVPLLSVTKDGTWYAVANLVICGGAWVLAGFSSAPRRPFSPNCSARAAVRALADQASITLSGVISGGYTSLTVAIVGAVNFSAVAQFAASDRFRSMAKQGEMAATNGLQGWIGSSSGINQGKRMRRSMAFMTFGGLLVGGSFAVAMLSWARFCSALASLSMRKLVCSWGSHCS